MDLRTAIEESTFSTKLALITALAWAIVAVFNLQYWAYGFGGFIPLRFSGELEIPGALPAILTPLSATFLHADFMHVGFNMLLLWFCGKGVERAIGIRGIVVLYIFGAYVSAGGHYLFNADEAGPMIGASGAVSAIVGAYALLYSRPRNGRGGWVHVAQLAGAWILIQLLIGLSSWGSPMPIAIVAHIFGFVAGLALARPLLLWNYRDA
ncbi:MAG: rhomboid family intramembrane serine protease [Parasphingopyxis sp.]|uniref:rhomboid family intramembrane serine protease n=1 Tax=Parasphingopyxis sp. TaxID=1920299 RepID=UPI0032EFCCAE